MFRFVRPIVAKEMPKDEDHIFITEDGTSLRKVGDAVFQWQRIHGKIDDPVRPVRMRHVMSTESQARNLDNPEAAAAVADLMGHSVETQREHYIPRLYERAVRGHVVVKGFRPMRKGILGVTK